MIKDLDLFGKLSPEQQKELEWSLLSVDPLDAKYREKITPLMPYISAAGEWNYFALVQHSFMRGMHKFGKAESFHVSEMANALHELNPNNVMLLEADKSIGHDQIALILELSRYVSKGTYLRMHPGTTSYDVVDTGRHWALKNCWQEKVRPKAVDVAKQIGEYAKRNPLQDAIMVGRTHNQHTSPLYFVYQVSCWAVDVVNAIKSIDHSVSKLEGKVAGIVGSSSSIREVVGADNFMAFEKYIVEDIIGLPLCPNPMQIIPKGPLVRFGLDMLLLNGVLANMANTIRLLYSAEIQELVSLTEKARLGGSSADAGKNNPINWENICGQYEVAKGGIFPLLALTVSDHQRDLRGSVQARYEPHRIIAMTYEALTRTEKGFKSLFVNKDKMKLNLEGVRKKPSEAMTGILKGHLFQHLEYGTAHESVKEWAKEAQAKGKYLLPVALEDKTFQDYWDNKLEDRQRDILREDIEKYAETCKPRTERNLKIVDNFT